MYLLNGVIANSTNVKILRFLVATADTLWVMAIDTVTDSKYSMKILIPM